MIGVVADDITGANDIGIMYAKAGIRTHVYSFTGEATLLPGLDTAEVVVLDTDSRFEDAKTAYVKVFAATRLLMKLGCSQFVNKTCSVFRGNIGAEFDAMQDALGQSFAVVVLGFPKNGRTTVDGTHYVHGRKLEESEFRRDPVHPMERSDLVGILQQQTERRVGRVGWETISQGAELLREEVERIRNRDEADYVILDVREQDDLAVIAEAVSHLPVWCGSSALAEEWAKRMSSNSENKQTLAAPHDPGLGVLVSAGSLMPQTAKQIDYLREQGTKVIEMETLRLLDEQQPRQAYVDGLIHRVAELIGSGHDVAVHSSHTPELVRETKEMAKSKGIGNTEISRLVSETLADLSAAVLERTGLNRLLIAGGDTSASFCRRMGVGGMRLWKEIQPGLPSCLTLTEPCMMLVLKSGSFGNEAFMSQAIDHLKAN